MLHDSLRDRLEVLLLEALGVVKGFCLGLHFEEIADQLLETVVVSNAYLSKSFFHKFVGLELRVDDAVTTAGQTTRLLLQELFLLAALAETDGKVDIDLIVLDQSVVFTEIFEEVDHRVIDRLRRHEDLDLFHVIVDQSSVDQLDGQMLILTLCV